ncbi:MAG: hypothetical protein HUJ31_04850, partial [Pseudomonadales bacterium]|nr:hypothetical protein [Pseudomonadales bacterium]
MRPILKTIALLSLISLIAGCDSGRSTGIAQIDVSASGTTNGVQGSVFKGPISAATVTVYDENGEAIPVSSATTSQPDGSYRVTFTAAAVDAGITGPLLIEADASGATAICDRDAPGTTDDCRTAPGNFVAFGESFTLPDPFVLRAVVDTIPAGTDTIT